MASILASVFSKALQVQHVKSLKSLASHVSLYLGIIIYTAVGAKVFQWIESPVELDRLATSQGSLVEARLLLLNKITNASSTRDLYTQAEVALASYEEVANAAAGEGVDLVTKDFSINWDYVQACFFALTILTTIGYGNFAARTFSGRLFCLLFGIIGIPFMLCVLADVGGIMAGLLQVTWGNHKNQIREWAEQVGILRQRLPEEESSTSISLEYSLGMLLGAITSLALFLALGAFLFNIWEDWSFFDSFYFCFVTMTTIGFGDMTPSISDNTMYMMFCTIYILVGLAFTSTTIELVRRQYAESWRKMLELRAQIKAQLKLADTLKKISEAAEKNDVDLGVNITGELEGLKKNLDAYKASGGGDGEFDDVDIQQLDWVEGNKKVRAFFIYETSL